MRACSFRHARRAATAHKSAAHQAEGGGEVLEAAIELCSSSASRRQRSASPPACVESGATGATSFRSRTARAFLRCGILLEPDRTPERVEGLDPRNDPPSDGVPAPITSSANGFSFRAPKFRRTPSEDAMLPNADDSAAV